MGKRTPKMGINLKERERGFLRHGKMSKRSERRKLESTPHEVGFEKDPQFDLKLN